MRKHIVLSVLALAVATPALAQVNQLQLDDLRARQQAAEQRSIDQANQQQALDARLRGEDAAATLAAQRAGVWVPKPPQIDPTLAPAASAPLPNYPSMPNDVLADSNKRVQDVARNKR